jgi:hypothetical protein
MYTRVVTGRGRPGTTDEAIQCFRDPVVPALLFVDRATGKVTTISPWDTDVDTLAAEVGGFRREQIAKVAASPVGSPTSELDEVAVRP